MKVIITIHFCNSPRIKDKKVVDDVYGYRKFVDSAISANDVALSPCYDASTGSLNFSVLYYRDYALRDDYRVSNSSIDARI